MKALACINELKKKHKNTDIDWESVLEKGYQLFLDRDSTAIDIGGHAGRHARVFANEIGCKAVKIFEPLPEQCRSLKDLFRANGNVDVFQLALSSECGEMPFVVNYNAPEESGLRERTYNDWHGKNLDTISVSVATLDSLDLQLDALDYIKIDTEGAEVDIIIGGLNLIEKFRPILSIEYGELSYLAYGKKTNTLYDLLKKMRYQLFDLFGNAFESLEEWDQCVNNFYWDFYGVPNERAERFKQLLDNRIYSQLPSCVR